MNKTLMKHVIMLLSSFLAILVIFAVPMTVQAADAGSSVDKHPLHISMNYVQEPGKGHTTPGALGQLSSEMENMWKELPITVIDAQGNELEVKKELNGHCERTVGNFANGEKVTIKVDTSKLPTGYHLSWESDYTYPKPIKNYSQFQVVVDSSMPARISLAKLNVKFDLQGGNIGSKTDAITNTVKTDNTVDFPTAPTKENLVFGGWFTELPNTESYKKLGLVGKRYYWNNKSLFSDYSCDWMSYNDTNVDPLYDGIFLLRAQWNANVAFTAQWKQIRSTVTFKDGNKTQTVKVETGKTIDTDALTDQSMPKAPTKDGYTFKEWNTKADGTGIAFTGSTEVNADTTVYAIYSLNMAQINVPATLELRDKTITQGDNLDLMSLVVSAKDTEDGDLTKDVKLVDNGGFDKDKVGTYTVTFKVSDKGGASVTKHATVTVSEKAVPQGASATAVPQTGDSANGLLYAALMGLPGVSLLVAGLRKRRKQH